MSADTWLMDAPGPRAKHRTAVGTAFGLVVLVALLGYAWHELAVHGQTSAEIWRVWGRRDVQKVILQGLLATLRAAAMSVLLSLALGGLLASMRLSKNRVLRAIARGWTEFFRALPTLLCMFFMYLGLPVIGIDISIFWALVLGELLYAGALFAEIFRAGIEAVPAGQKEAAKALGVGPAWTFVSVVMPQAFRWMLPLLITQTVMVLKETSMGFIIGYADMLRQGRLVIEFLGSQFATPIYTLVGITYIAINLTLSAIARGAERRSRGGRKKSRGVPQRKGGAAVKDDVALSIEV